jgi:AraC family cel operon transcriptional repressor
MGVQHNTPERFGGIAHLPAWLARPFYRAGYRYPFHDHTYCEIFWVESGEIRHSIGDRDHPAAREELLQPGDLRFIHPATVHALGADAPAVLVNLAFPVEILDQLRPFAGELPFVSGEATAFHLTPNTRAALRDWAEALADPKLDRLQVGAFLLWLMAELQRGEAHSDDGTPAWLKAALASFDHPAQLALGVTGLATLAGRSPGHVSRAVRKRYGCSTIQLVNRRRLAWLARQLRMTDEAVPDLAATCGLANLGNCYRHFRAIYGCPPGEYRRQARLAVADTFTEPVGVGPVKKEL